MNNTRRKRIQEAMDLLEQARSILEECRDEEQEAYDNLPESIQEGDRGQAMESAVSELDDCCSSVDDAVASAYTALEGCVHDQVKV